MGVNFYKSHILYHINDNIYFTKLHPSGELKTQITKLSNLNYL